MLCQCCHQGDLTPGYNRLVNWCSVNVATRETLHQDTTAWGIDALSMCPPGRPYTRIQPPGELMLCQCVHQGDLTPGYNRLVNWCSVNVATRETLHQDTTAWGIDALSMLPPGRPYTRIQPPGELMLCQCCHQGDLTPGYNRLGNWCSVNVSTRETLHQDTTAWGIDALSMLPAGRPYTRIQPRGELMLCQCCHQGDLTPEYNRVGNWCSVNVATRETLHQDTTAWGIDVLSMLPPGRPYTRIQPPGELMLCQCCHQGDLTPGYNRLVNWCSVNVATRETLHQDTTAWGIDALSMLPPGRPYTRIQPPGELMLCQCCHQGDLTPGYNRLGIDALSMLPPGRPYTRIQPPGELMLCQCCHQGDLTPGYNRLGNWCSVNVSTRETLHQNTTAWGIDALSMLPPGRPYTRIQPRGELMLCQCCHQGDLTPGYNRLGNWCSVNVATRETLHQDTTAWRELMLCQCCHQGDLTPGYNRLGNWCSVNVASRETLHQNTTAWGIDVLSMLPPGRPYTRIQPPGELMLCQCCHQGDLTPEYNRVGNWCSVNVATRETLHQNTTAWGIDVLSMLPPGRPYTKIQSPGELMLCQCCHQGDLTPGYNRLVNWCSVNVATREILHQDTTAWWIDALSMCPPGRPYTRIQPPGELMLCQCCHQGDLTPGYNRLVNWCSVNVSTRETLHQDTTAWEIDALSMLPPGRPYTRIQPPGELMLCQCCHQGDLTPGYNRLVNWCSVNVSTRETLHQDTTAWEIDALSMLPPGRPYTRIQPPGKLMLCQCCHQGDLTPGYNRLGNWCSVNVATRETLHQNTTAWWIDALSMLPPGRPYTRIQPPGELMLCQCCLQGDLTPEYNRLGNWCSVNVATRETLHQDTTAWGIDALSMLPQGRPYTRIQPPGKLMFCQCCHQGDLTPGYNRLGNWCSVNVATRETLHQDTTAWGIDVLSMLPPGRPYTRIQPPGELMFCQCCHQGDLTPGYNRLGNWCSVNVATRETLHQDTTAWGIDVLSMLPPGRPYTRIQPRGELMFCQCCHQGDLTPGYNRLGNWCSVNVATRETLHQDTTAWGIDALSMLPPGRPYTRIQPRGELMLCQCCHQGDLTPEYNRVGNWCSVNVASRETLHQNTTAWGIDALSMLPPGRPYTRIQPRGELMFCQCCLQGDLTPEYNRVGNWCSVNVASRETLHQDTTAWGIDALSMLPPGRPYTRIQPRGELMLCQCCHQGDLTPEYNRVGNWCSVNVATRETLHQDTIAWGIDALSMLPPGRPYTRIQPPGELMLCQCCHQGDLTPGYNRLVNWCSVNVSTRETLHQDTTAWGIDALSMLPPGRPYTRIQPPGELMLCQCVHQGDLTPGYNRLGNWCSVNVATRETLHQDTTAWGIDALSMLPPGRPYTRIQPPGELMLCQCVHQGDLTPGYNRLGNWCFVNVATRETLHQDTTAWEIDALSMLPPGRPYTRIQPPGKLMLCQCCHQGDLTPEYNRLVNWCSVNVATRETLHQDTTAWWIDALSMLPPGRPYTRIQPPGELMLCQCCHQGDLTPGYNCLGNWCSVNVATRETLHQNTTAWEIDVLSMLPPGRPYTRIQSPGELMLYQCCHQGDLTPGYNRLGNWCSVNVASRETLHQDTTAWGIDDLSMLPPGRPYTRIQPPGELMLCQCCHQGDLTPGYNRLGNWCSVNVATRETLHQDTTAWGIDVLSMLPPGRPYTRIQPPGELMFCQCCHQGDLTPGYNRLGNWCSVNVATRETLHQNTTAWGIDVLSMLPPGRPYTRIQPPGELMFCQCCHQGDLTPGYNRLGNWCSLNVATRETLHQDTVDKLIDSQVNYELKRKIEQQYTFT